MLEISKRTNLLEQNIYKYTLQDVEEPNLYREMFDYESVPKIAFNHRRVPINMPEDIWITDTSFRDGQQSDVYKRQTSNEFLAASALIKSCGK